MHKNQLLLLAAAALLLVAGAIALPQLLADPAVPIGRWSSADEVDLQEPGPDPAAAESSDQDLAGERAAAGLGGGAGPGDERAEVLLRGRVVDKSSRGVPNATVWLDFGRGGPRGGGGGQNRQRRVPDPVTTDASGRFAFQGQTFRNLRVNLQVAHEHFAPGAFDKDVGAVAAEVDLGDLMLGNGGEVRGRVTDLDGNGIANAELRLQPENGNPQRFARDRDRTTPPFTTDNNGFYRRPHTANGDWSLTAAAKAHTEGRSAVFVVEEDRVVEVADIRLGPGYEVSGTVRNERGEPIAKASVAMRSEGGRPAGPGTEGPPRGGNGGRGGPGANPGGGREHRTTTDEKGQFFLEHLPGASMRLDVDADGYLHLRVEAIDPKLGRPLELTLQDGLRIDGVVKDGDGELVTMFAFRAVRLRGLPAPGQADVDVGALMERMRDPNLGEEERAQLRQQMGSLREQFAGARPGGGRPGQDGGQGGGRGQDAGQGGRGGNELDRPTKHADGRFQATGLQEGIYEVQVQSPDHARYRSAELEVRAGLRAAEVQVVLHGGYFVAGAVVDQNGNAVAGAQVRLRTPSAFDNGPGGRGRNGGGNQQPDVGGMAREFQRMAMGTQLQLEATTDDDGAFVLKHVPSGTYRLEAEARGHADVRTEPFELTADRSAVELRLGALGSIAGTVRGLGEAEIASARVAAVPLGQGLGAMMGRGRQGGGGGGGGTGPFASTEVAADGSYRLENLAPGEYLVRSWIGSPQDLMRELMPLFLGGQLPADAVVAGGQETRLDLTVTRPQLGIVQGSVNHNGAPADGFRVDLVAKTDASQATPGGGPGGGRGRGGFGGMGSRNLQGGVSATGQFRIEKVPAGTYQLRVQTASRADALHEQTIQVFADTTAEVAVSIQTCTLEGTVAAEGLATADLDGRIQLLAGVDTLPDNLNEWMRQNRNLNARVQDGAFRFEAVAQGNYLLVLTVRGRERVTLTVALAGDQRLQLVAGKPATEPPPRTPAPANR